MEDEVYKCIKEFVLDKYEDDEALENEHYIVPVGSTWELSGYAHMNDIRLVSELGWIEIDFESLESLFIEV